MRIWPALFALVLLAALGARTTIASDLEAAREQAIQSGKPLMVVFR